MNQDQPRILPVSLPASGEFLDQLQRLVKRPTPHRFFLLIFVHMLKKKEILQGIDYNRWEGMLYIQMLVLLVVD